MKKADVLKLEGDIAIYTTSWVPRYRNPEEMPHNVGRARILDPDVTHRDKEWPYRTVRGARIQELDNHGKPRRGRGSAGSYILPYRLVISTWSHYVSERRAYVKYERESAEREKQEKKAQAKKRREVVRALRAADFRISRSSYVDEEKFDTVYVEEDGTVTFTADNILFMIGQHHE